MKDSTEAYYGLPREVVFCERCVMSNQRPCAVPEFRHMRNREGAKYLHIDEEGVCDACRVAEIKEGTDWTAREGQLLQLLDKHRRKDGCYDCVVPGSGGKDSAYAAHLLKYKYGMHPLTVAWPPILYTDYGYRNWRNWIEVGGFDNISLKPNGLVMKLVTRLAIQNLLHPFQTFILGQKSLAPKIAARFGIPLVFFGEHGSDYGNPIADNASSLHDHSWHVLSNLSEVYIAGMRLPELIEKHSLELADLMTFLPAPPEGLKRSNIEIHYLGYYVKWVPQEVYYYAVEHTGFQARPFRTEGTYSKYNSIDDEIDDLHYYTTHIKFGIGRATYDASQEIRNHHLTRDEGVALVQRFDGERPSRYIREVLDYIEMSEDEFFSLCDEFRSPHLWEKVNGAWRLRHQVTNL